MVNDQPVTLWERIVVIAILGVTCFLMALVYHQNEYIFSNEVQWADLSYGTHQSAWSASVLPAEDLWIKGMLEIAENCQTCNGLFIGLNGSYEVFWDGQLIGKNGSAFSPGTIHYLLQLDEQLTTPGSHTVLLRVHAPRLIRHQLYAGIVLGDISNFSLKPVFQLTAVVMVSGLLLIIFSSLLFRKTHPSILWLIAAVILYLGLNYMKVWYNYPHTWHEMRLMLYGISNALLAVTVIRYTWHRIEWPRTKYRRIFLVALSGSYLLAFYLLEFDTAKYYILLSAPAICMALLLMHFQLSKNGILILVQLYIFSIASVVEVGFLMILGYLFIILLDYFGRKSNPRVSATIRKKLSHLVANYQGVKRLVALTDVVAIKGANNYSEIILQNKERYLCDKSLSSIMKEASEQFTRIHKSYLIDFDQVAGLRSNPHGGKTIVLKNQLEVPVGRKFSKEVLSRLV